MFRVSSLLDLSADRPSLLIPIFNHENSNIPYVQITDEFFTIKDFSPYFHAEEYNQAVAAGQYLVDVNYPGVFGLRRHDGQIICCNIEEILNYWDNNKEAISNFHLLQVQIARLIAERLPIQYDAWRKLAQSAFSSDAQRGFWLDSEASSFQKSEQIWRKINADSEAERPRALIREEITGGFDPEYFLTALNKASNYEASNWVSIWFKVLRSLPSDERVLDVAKSWLYYKVGGGADINIASNVFCAVLDRQSVLKYYDDDFIEFVVDLVNEQTIFSEEFAIPKKYIVLAFEILGGELDAEQFSEIIVNSMERNYFDLQTTSFLGLELLYALSRSNGISLDLRNRIQKGVLRKIEILSFDEEIAGILKELKRLLR